MEIVGLELAATMSRIGEPDFAVSVWVSTVGEKPASQFFVTDGVTADCQKI